jgi:hypothetical protein
MIPQFADNHDPDSLASRLRLKRNQRFRYLIEGLPRPLKILDVGGFETVWENIGFVNRPDIQIILLNVHRCETSYSNVRCVIGDARHMPQFSDEEFDVVYSNSVIEHVGGLCDMKLMADEIRRVGKRYFLQTPYRYFPIEPHFLFPMFQFLPLPLQTYLVQHFDLGWMGRHVVKEEAEKAVLSIQLLSRGELRSFFPDADLENERFFGLTKSLLAYKMLACCLILTWLFDGHFN